MPRLKHNISKPVAGCLFWSFVLVSWLFILLSQYALAGDPEASQDDIADILLFVVVVGLMAFQTFAYVWLKDNYSDDEHTP